jgi:hypothetical protein
VPVKLRIYARRRAPQPPRPHGARQMERARLAVEALIKQGPAESIDIQP